MEDPYLLSRIKFKPAVIDELAREAGVELGAIDFMKRFGITEAQLRERFGDFEDVSNDESSSNGEVEMSGTVSGQASNRPRPKDSSENGAPEPHVDPTRTDSDVSSGRSSGLVREGQEATAGRTSEAGNSKTGGSREFISYIAVSPDEPDEESDGLSHEERISLEDKAIDLIIAMEPGLQRTRTNNPGFDLMELGDGGEIVRFIEVKAMSSSLQGRSVTLTKRQFELAWVERDSYCLYIVENAGDAEEANIVKIKDPVGWSKYFTFDRGWKEISQDSK